MDYGNTKTLNMHRRVGSATLSQLAFPEESNPNFLMEKPQWEDTAVKTKEKEKEKKFHTVTLHAPGKK